MDRLEHHVLIYAVVGILAGPLVTANTSASQLDAHLLTASSENQAQAADANAAIDATSAAADGRLVGTRASPRVSNTRCAFVACAPQCNIKGLRDPQRGLIYRTPANPEYTLTRGEKMFCSRAEATAAGYHEDSHG